MSNGFRFMGSIVPVLFLLAGAVGPFSTAAAEGNPREEPAKHLGVFVGAGWPDSRIVDVEGFANWGNPGWAVEYGTRGFLVGALAGKRIRIAELPLRFELDGTYGDMRGRTNQLDPAGLDETAESKFLWIVTARAGVEGGLGGATFFLSAGPAVARIDNQAIDVDFGPGRPTQPDPDDSFRDRSMELGWTLTAGVELPFPDQWKLRLEGMHLDFGSESHRVNHSGDGRCGPGGERRPCLYSVENRLRIVRLAITRSFGQ